MPRNYLYKCRLRGEHGATYIVEIRPASPTPNTIFPTTPTIITIPAGVIKIDSLAEESFKDDMAIGLQQTSTVKVTVNFAHLRGSEALDDLYGYLMTYWVDGGGSINLTAGTRTFTTLNVWRIFTDRGLGDGIIYKLFEGAVRFNPEHQPDITIRSGVATSYELSDLFRISAEMVTMQNLCSEMLVEGFTAGDGWGENKGIVVDWAYEKSGARYMVYTFGYQTVFQPIGYVFRRAQYLCNRVYCQFMQIAEFVGLTNPHLQFRGYKEHVSTGDFDDDPWASPWDHWGFHESPTSDERTQDDDDPALLDRDAYGIMVLIKTDDGTRNIAGLCLPGSDSLYVFETVYNFLIQCCDVAVCRGRVAYSANGIELWFERPYEGATNPDANVIERSDLRMPAGAQPVIKAKSGGKVLTGVKMELRGAVGQDKKDFAVRAGGSTLDPTWGNKSIFDVDPMVGEGSWWSESLATIEGTSGAVSAMRHLYPWKFYYMADLFGSGNLYPKRCDGYVAFDDGLHEPSGTKPFYTLPTPSDLEGYSSAVRVVSASVQNSAFGMQWQFMDQYLQLFGDARMAWYPLRVTLNRGMDQIGRGVALPPYAGATTHDAKGLLNSGRNLPLFGWGIVVHTKPDYKTDRVELTLQGITII